MGRSSNLRFLGWTARWRQARTQLEERRIRVVARQALSIIKFPLRIVAGHGFIVVIIKVRRKDALVLAQYFEQILLLSGDSKEPTSAVRSLLTTGSGSLTREMIIEALS